MFKVGDLVICKRGSIEHKKGEIYTITDMRDEPRDDSNLLCRVNNSLGFYSANYFESYNIYCRKDKINELKKKLRSSKNIISTSFD